MSSRDTRGWADVVISSPPYASMETKGLDSQRKSYGDSSYLLYIRLTKDSHQ